MRCACVCIGRRNDDQVVLRCLLSAVCMKRGVNLSRSIHLIAIVHVGSKKKGSFLVYNK